MVRALLAGVCFGCCFDRCCSRNFVSVRLLAVTELISVPSFVCWAGEHDSSEGQV